MADMLYPCKEQALDESYQNYLLDLSQNNESFLKYFPEYCRVSAGGNQAIFYCKSEDPFTGGESGLRYSQVPRCYGLMGTRELEEIGVIRVQRFPQLGLRGQGALVGIVDTGIALDQPLFLYEDGTTKVRRLWDQTEQTGQPPTGYPFGREWTGEEIDDVLRDRKQGSEDEMETLPGDEEGHGTVLAALAAGREREDFSGVAPDSDLIVVKLKQPKEYLREFYSIPDEVWACQEDDVILGIRYILEQATALDRPVSICLGIGTNLGGHDGTSSLDRLISANSLLPGVAFHIAAGNEGIASHHYHGYVQEGQNYTSIEFNVSEDENGFIMELWGKAPTVFSVGLVSPGGENVDRIQLKLGEFRRIRFFPEETILEIRSFSGETISGDQVIRMNFRDPVPGVWKLRVYASGDSGLSQGDGVAREFDLWLPISNFIKEDTFFLNASPNETITAPGTSAYSMTYTPYDSSNDSLYVRASRGYTRDGRIKPDLAAPGVSVQIPSTGTASRNRTVTGSSVAAAFGAGIGALIQEWAIVKGNNLFLNGQSMRFYLIQGATRSEAYAYPNREWGYGMVNLYDAFLSFRG